MKRLLVGGAVLAVGIGGMGLASAEKPTGFKVTGGGQIIENPQAGGPGDTVGFNAQEIAGDDEASPGDDDDAARGQFQYVQRGENESGNQPANDSFHGVVTCLISGGEAVQNEEEEDDQNEEEGLMSGMARFGGFVKGGNAVDGPFFTVDVNDNGQGADAEDDMILVRMTTAPCADNPEDENNEIDELARLGRGNVKIHNNPDGQAGALANARAAAAMVQMATR